MKCKKCGSTDVSIQAVTETKTKGKGLYYWTIGWLVNMFKWIMFTLPTLVVRLFGRKKQKVISKTHKMAICQSCGNSWKVK